MRLAFGMMPASFRELEQSVASVEDAGFDTIWVGDMQSTHRELYVSLAAVTSKASRSFVGTGVTNPVTRDPAITAGALASLAELSQGRSFLGIGAGDSALHNVGLQPARLAEVEEYVTSIQNLWEHGEAVYAGRNLRLTWWKDRFRIPIYVAAHGPRSLEMAGRIADGVIVGTGLTPAAVARAKECIARGAASAGKSLDSLKVWFLSMVNTHPDEMLARRQIATPLAALGNILIRNGADGKDLPGELVMKFQELERRYDFRDHASASFMGANASLIEEMDLLNYLAERFAVVGNGKTCADRIESLRRAGVENLWFTRTLTDTNEFVARWANDVAPLLRSGPN